MRVTGVMLGRVVERIARPTGLWVVVAGPDGSGKSTVATALPQVCAGLFRRHRHQHWRPGLLPAPSSVLRRGGGGDPAQPHGQAPHGTIASLARLAYFWLDVLVGTLVLTLPPRVRTGLIVTERGWWDMVVDPHRYRLGLPVGLVRGLGRLSPRPDLLLVLDAPANVLRSRKQELPPEELERQRRAWLDLNIPGVETVVLDATRPLDQVVREARERIVDHLERRAMRRLGAGWVELPPGKATRWWIPRGPSRVAARGLEVYQPVTRKGRAGWELARLLARMGVFRLLPRGEAPPREVRARLAEHLPTRTTYAVMRRNHQGRFVALCIREDGSRWAVAKVATTAEGAGALAREADAIRRYGSLLTPPVRAPRILAEGQGVLVLEASGFRPRARPWDLPEELAGALGALAREGVRHGDAAPWNVLDGPQELVLLDWERAAPSDLRAWDLCHWLVQAHALLGRPTRAEVAAALRGRGPLGRSVHAFCSNAGIDVEQLWGSMLQYLVESAETWDPTAADGARGLAAREELTRFLEQGLGVG